MYLNKIFNGKTSNHVQSIKNIVQAMFLSLISQSYRLIINWSRFPSVRPIINLKIVVVFVFIKYVVYICITTELILCNTKLVLIHTNINIVTNYILYFYNSEIK